MVDNGKISFKGLVDSLIKELLKAELKNAIGQVAGAIGGMGSGGGGGGGGGGGIGLGDIWNFGKSLLGFADGGQPPVGKASIVGERGPELFIPKTAGTIVPNGGGAGGNTVINNYNISAVDAKSVAQLFAENRRALLGTVRAAEKELPYRGR
jgi:phage-related minor tail protein